MAELNLKLYDLDGCLYHKYSHGGEIEPVENWLITSNQKLWHYELQRLEINQFSRVVVAYGTNRQDKERNLYNIDRGGSLTPVLPLVQSYLFSHSSPDVLLDTFLMSDLYGQKNRAGDNYKALLREEFMGSDSEKHASWVFDHSKVSLIYAHAHRVAVINPGYERIVIDYYDDCKHILDAVRNFYLKNPQCLPKNVELCIHHYNGEKLSHLNVIKGCGLVDKHYDWSVRCMAFMAAFSDQKGSLQNSPQSYKELKIYHKNNVYFTDPSPRLFIDNQFDVGAFLSFRDNQIHKLNSDKALIKKGYSTALELFDQNLIPGKLIYRNPLFSTNRSIEMSKQEEAVINETKPSYCCFPFFKKRHQPYSKLEDAMELDTVSKVN